MSDKCVAIIIIRGGGERISRKNIKIFAGSLSISYPVTEILNLESFGRVSEILYTTLLTIQSR
jgi:CMP-N-acetylneuraminic acid synthetase